MVNEYRLKYTNDINANLKIYVVLNEEHFNTLVILNLYKFVY